MNNLVCKLWWGSVTIQYSCSRILLDLSLLSIRTTVCSRVEYFIEWLVCMSVKWPIICGDHLSFGVASVVVSGEWWVFLVWWWCDGCGQYNILLVVHWHTPKSTALYEQACSLERESNSTKVHYPGTLAGTCSCRIFAWFRWLYSWSLFDYTELDRHDKFVSIYTTYRVIVFTNYACGVP